MTVLFKNIIEKNNFEIILPRFALKLRKIRIVLKKPTTVFQSIVIKFRKFVPILVKFAIIKACKMAKEMS